MRENQKLNSQMVLLTIAISGGPFLGLLGTVVGVMITFAAIAATGDVNVNAIAPGIAAALVATVAGLAVAIPALFGYNYLSRASRRISADMHVFIDEFVAKHGRTVQPIEELRHMAEHQGEDNEPYDDINITPMLDLAYVLLVIFIIMTTASVQGIKVNLPKASADAEPGQAEDQGRSPSTTRGRSFSIPIRSRWPSWRARLRSFKAADARSAGDRSRATAQHRSTKR